MKELESAYKPAAACPVGDRFDAQRRLALWQQRQREKILSMDWGKPPEGPAPASPSLALEPPHQADPGPGQAAGA